MNYLAITKADILNGSGLGVVLWVSGCRHRCKSCQNSYSWDRDMGVPFDDSAKEEIFAELEKDWCTRITYLGGNPTEEYNLPEITELAKEIKTKYPTIKQWCYSGETYEELKNLELMQYLDILVDGEFIEELADVNYPYAGSTNQRLIDVQNSLKEDKIILYNIK